MKTSYTLIGSVAVAVSLLTGCNSEGGSAGTNDLPTKESQTETNQKVSNVNMDFQLTSVYQGANNGKTMSRAATLSQGTMTFTNVDTNKVKTETFNLFINADDFTISTTKTLVLTPGTYTAEMVTEKDGIQYVGQSQFVVVDGQKISPKMTMSPVVGEYMTNVTVSKDLFNIDLQYKVDELSSFINPKIGLIVDGGSEQIFTINKATGLSSTKWNLTPGNHQVKANFYDGSVQIGKSKLSPYTIDFSQGKLANIDIIPLSGTSTFTFDMESSVANMTFNIPNVLAEETGGIANLRTVVIVANETNTTEHTLSLSLDGENYTASLELPQAVKGDFSYSMEFYDINDNEKIGSCSVDAELKSSSQTKTCDIEIIRRGVAGGDLLNSIGLMVYNSDGKEVSGAKIYDGSKLIGLTGLDGFLQTYLIKGSHTIKSTYNNQEGMVNFTQNGVLKNSNIDIILNDIDGNSSMFQWTYQYETDRSYEARFVDSGENGVLIQDGNKTIKLNSPENKIFEKNYQNTWSTEVKMFDNGNVAINDRDNDKVSILNSSGSEIGSYEYNSSVSDNLLHMTKNKDRLFFSTRDYSNDTTQLISFSNQGLSSNVIFYNESYNTGEYFNEDLNLIVSHGDRYVTGVGRKYYLNFSDLNKQTTNSLEVPSGRIIQLLNESNTVLYSHGNQVAGYDLVNQNESWSVTSNNFNSWNTVLTKDNNYLLFDGNYTDDNNRNLVSLNLSTRESCQVAYGKDTYPRTKVSNNNGISLTTKKDSTYKISYVNASDCSKVILDSAISTSWESPIKVIDVNGTNSSYPDNNKIYISKKTSESNNSYEIKTFDTDGNNLAITTVENSYNCNNFVAKRTQNNTIIYLKDNKVEELDENLNVLWSYSHNTPFQCDGDVKLNIFYDRKEIFIKEGLKLHKIKF